MRGSVPSLGSKQKNKKKMYKPFNLCIIEGHKKVG